MFKKILLSGVVAFGLTACGNGGADVSDTAVIDKSAAKVETAAASTGRDQIKIVGSSTVYPFATTVAENFGRSTSFKTPIVESTGSGGGLKLFCSGLGNNYPCLLYTSPSPRDATLSRMPSSA